MARMPATIVFLLWGSIASALEVQLYISACHPGPPCYLDLRISADRRATIGAYPAAHRSGHLTLSKEEFLDLQALLRREDFFSLPEELGVRLFDGPSATLEVRDGKKKRQVVLFSLPDEFGPIWRTDTGTTGRAYRVCEHVRALAKLADSVRCPGVPSAENEE